MKSGWLWLPAEGYQGVTGAGFPPVPSLLLRLVTVIVSAARLALVVVVLDTLVVSDAALAVAGCIILICKHIDIVDSINIYFFWFCGFV